jgi:hypothetical protein
VEDFVTEYEETLRWLEQNADYSICSNCGGTGINAAMCCNGYMCCCQGMPVDFENECKQCGRTYKEN